MTGHRFFVDASLSGDRIELPGAIAHRIAKVLRLRAGGEITLFDGSGADVRARLESVKPDVVVARQIQRYDGPREPRVAVHLYQSITRGERFDWLVEKATELGAAAVTPLVTARSVVKTSGNGQRVDRWRRIAVEAAEQCERSAVPRIHTPMPLDGALAAADGILLLPFERADHTTPTIGETLGARIDDLFALSAVGVFIGPEGGYEDAEVRRAIDAGAAVVTMGERVLRSETAGIVALTLVMSAIGELG